MSTAAPAALDLTFLTSCFDPEPGAQHGLPLARWLVGRGHRVKVLTTFPQYPLGRLYPGYRLRLRQWETIDGVPVLRVPSYPSHDRSGARRAVTYLSFMASATLVGVPLIGPSDVIFHFEPPPTNGVPALILKHVHGAPIVHHIADMWPETVVDSGMISSDRAKSIAGAVIGEYCKFLYRRDDAISVLSPGFQRLLLERGVPQEKVHVVYNWADEKLFFPVPRDPELARTLGLSGGFTFMYAGNLGPMQNIETLVLAAARLREVPGLRLAIVGTGPMEADVREAVRAAGATNVVMVPRRPYTEMNKIHALADVLMVHLRDYPFLRTTIPSKTQVAMACGRPLLMAVHGDAADLVTASGAGVCAHPQDPVSIADAMLTLHRLPAEKLTELGERGRRFYDETLSLDASGAKMEALFARAAQRGRGRQS